MPEKETLVWLVERKIRNAGKVAKVKGQHGEVVVEGSCPKQDVKIRNELPPSSQEGADFSEPLHDRLIHTHDLIGTQKLPERSQMRFWIGLGKGGVVDSPTVIQLMVIPVGASFCKSVSARCLPARALITQSASSI